VALGTCLALGGTASAQLTASAPATAMRLDYQAPAGCPTADAFTSEVRARAPQSRSEAASAVEVRIVANASSPGVETFEGRMVITDESGATPSRAVRGDSCAEVVRALALAVAMTFEPVESAPPVVVAVSPPAPPERPPVVPPPPARPRLHVSAGLKGSAESGVGPRVAPALGIYGDVAAGSLSLRLGAARAVSPLVARGAGKARFARTTATLDGCPLRWRAAPGLGLSVVPCLAFEIGSLTSDGQSTVDPESTSRLWVASGLSTRLVWEPVGPLVLELEGRANVPLTRDRFFFRPAEDVFEAPIVAFSVGLAGGVRFW
jgi:hypothetical protein